MRIYASLADAGEMLERVEDARRFIAIGRTADERCHFRRVFRERAAVGRADVGDGCEVHVDAKILERLARFFRTARGLARIARLPDFELRRRRRDERFAAHDVAAFFVDADEERHFLMRFLALRIVLHVRNEGFRLLRAFEVAVKEQHAADVELAQHELAVVREVCALHANHHHLADLLRQRHLADDGVRLFVERLRRFRCARRYRLL